MFIKVTTTAGRRYAQLVESFRNEQGQPRQRTLATLGRLEPGGEVDRLIAALNRAQGRDESVARGARIESLRFLDARSFGDVWALWQYVFTGYRLVDVASGRLDCSRLEGSLVTR